MSMMDAGTPTGRRRTSPALLLWITGVGAIVVLHFAERLLNFFGRSTTPVSFFAFFAWLLVISLTLYGFAVMVRWILRKLFWTVGRRLFLSYLLIGLLPFFLMTVLLLTVSYMFAAVMTQAALRAERQVTLGQMESWALEYVVSGRRPAGALESLEVYDTAQQSGEALPEWLRTRSFSGLVNRDKTALLVASRQFPATDATGDPRSIVFVQPINKEWADQLYDRHQMVVWTANARSSGTGSNDGLNIESNDGLKDVFLQNVFRKIIWGDLTDLSDWGTGSSLRDQRLFTLIANPPRNILSYYFGASAHDYFDILASIIVGLAVALMMMYAVAALFAGILIFSISRAVNRIEKGTHAVERGDFTYRIRMKPYNQLGAMAQSFDRMTESIASLLTTVGEKERLQSEIEIAASIQRNLLPKEGPRFGGVSFSAHFEPTASIGGDYYDVFNLDKSRLAVAIGDVSGHGLSTGLVMAMVKAAITTLVEEGADESSIFRRLNELVYRSTERRAFMTLAFTIFDMEKGTIRHTNAGHLYPYLLRRGSAQPTPIEAPSFPLGVRPSLETLTVETDLAEGDAIVYLSDGIIEAQDEHGEPLGFDKLEHLLGEETDRSPSALRDSILASVARHSGTRPADDDRTIMVIRFDSLRFVADEGEQPRMTPAIVEA
jgi:serine phosphatase RsbU (regulator of sigma subunit)